MPDEPNANGQPDPNATDPSAPGKEPAPPAKPPEQTVPLATHVAERRQLQGRIASLESHIRNLEAKGQEPQKPASQSEEDELVDKWHARLRLKEPLSVVQALRLEVDEMKKQVALGQQAHATITAQTSRAMDKAEKIADESIDKDLERVGFTKESWTGFVASQMTDDDVAEVFANPSAMHDIVKRCKKLYEPQINLAKANEANRLKSLPKQPGPGGTPPGPPQEERLKVGKPLHARAFNRLQDTMKVGQGG